MGGLPIQVMRALGIEVLRGFFPIRGDDPLTYVEPVRAGFGLGGILRAVGDPDPGLERTDLIADLPVLPVWLTVMPNMRQSPRLRRVLVALAAGFAA